MTLLTFTLLQVIHFGTVNIWTIISHKFVFGLYAILCKIMTKIVCNFGCFETDGLCMKTY